MDNLSRVVALLPECWERYASLVEMPEPDAAAAPRGPVPTVSQRVSVVPVQGLIMPRSSMWGTSVQQVGNWIRQAVDDPGVGAVVLDVDSPGGSPVGVTELAAEIRSYRGGKPIVAVSSGMAASAAYWIASAADEVVVSPSATAGSIGVYAIHQDVSQADERDGVRTTIISAGKYKVEGNPYSPLDETTRAALQQRVDEIYAQFVADVAAGRRSTPDEVRAGYGEGRMLGAERAVAAGLADRVGTLGETIARLAGSRFSTSTRAEAGGPDEAAAAAQLELGLERERLALAECEL